MATVEQPKTHQNILCGNEGYESDQIHVCQSFSAKRSVVTAPMAGKPSVARLANGDLLMSYIKGYAMDVTYTRVEVMRSEDNGESWGEPICAVPDSFEPRDNYLIPLQDGQVILVYFQCIPQRPFMRGPYITRSQDAGATWEEPRLIDTSAFCPDGPWVPVDRGHVQLPSGEVLLFVSDWHDSGHPATYVMRSSDNGHTFSEFDKISDIAGDSTFTQLPSGKLLGALRVNHVDWPHRRANPQDEWKHESVHFLAAIESDDDGRTWSDPVSLTGFNEIPGHLLALKDGTAVLTFGVRHYPLGIHALVRESQATSWENAKRVVLAWHGELAVHNGWVRHAIGHPYSVQLDDKRILTAYYRWQKPNLDGDSCCIETVIWEVGDVL